MSVTTNSKQQHRRHGLYSVSIDVATQAGTVFQDTTWRYDFDVSCVPPTDGTRIGRGNLLLVADGSAGLSVRIPIVYVKSEVE